MPAISSNGTGGGNWSNPASWAGGVVPTLAALDDVTIVAGDTITVDTTGLGARTIASLAGILTWAAGATTDLTIGNGTSDALVTFAATGYWRAGTAATPLTGLHTVTLNGLVATQAATAGHLNMAACNTTTSGLSIVCDRTVYGVAETYTHPVTGVAYATRRNFTRIASQINTAQANAVFVEDLKLRTGGGDIVVFPGSHISNNGQQNTPQRMTVAAYNNVTRTATMTANFATQIAVNAVTGAPTSGARGYTEASVFTITAPSTAKYWGFTGAASANPQFDLQNCTLRWFNGNGSGFNQLNGKIFQGVVFIGPAPGVNNSAMGLRHTSQAVQFVSCVIDSFVAQNLTPQFFFNSFFCIAARNADLYNVLTSSDFYDCFFQDCFQVIANSSGATFTRCGVLQCQTAFNVTVATDCHSNGISSMSLAIRTIRPVLGRVSTLIWGLSGEAPRYCESPVFNDTVTTLYTDVNNRTAQTRSGNTVGIQSPSGATAPSTIGIKLAPGGNTTGFTTPPDTIPVPPSGATIYNRLVTTAAIAPTFASEPFRPAQHEYQFIVTSGRAYSFTVPILSVSGFTPTSLTAVRLILTWADGTSVTTTVPSLTANVWSLVNVAGTAPVSGSATLQVYVQANIGNVYIDYPLDCDPAGYRWTNGVPQVSQTRLADSSAGTTALAVWSFANAATQADGTTGKMQYLTNVNAGLIPACV